jgi:release factor glutamine methyltransferase
MDEIHSSLKYNNIHNKLKIIKYYCFLAKIGFLNQKVKIIHQENSKKLKKKNYNNIIYDIANSKPFEYIMEECIFMGNILKCTPSTLIPRKYSEVLVKTALKFLKPKNSNRSVIFDIGTGTGNIAISLAKNNKNLKIYASEISDKAYIIAKNNIYRYNLQNDIELLKGDFFEPFKEKDLENKADIILCNPPYIPTKKIDTLPKEVINYEPHLALNAGPYGIDYFLKLIKFSPYYLKKGGYLIFEFGLNQDKMVKRLLERNEYFSDICFHKHRNKKRVVSTRCISQKALN